MSDREMKVGLVVPDVVPREPHKCKCITIKKEVVGYGSDKLVEATRKLVTAAKRQVKAADELLKRMIAENYFPYKGNHIGREFIDATEATEKVAREIIKLEEGK